jgi:hypothetical protein
MITLDELMAIQDKVFIAKPAGELARYSEYNDTLDAVITPPQTMRMGLYGTYIMNLQNELARAFMQTDCDYFWLLNDDQLYPADTLIRLLQHKKDVITPLCLERGFPFPPLIYGKRNPTGTHDRIFLKRGERGLKRIGACGGGGMLVHRRVMEAIGDPWWTVQMATRDNGTIEQTTEDLDFCDRVVEKGFEIWVDLETSLGHIAQFTIRSMMDNRGQWQTVLTRGAARLAIPTAQPAEPQLIVVPELVGKL